jgi:hypothetical protein
VRLAKSLTVGAALALLGGGSAGAVTGLNEPATIRVYRGVRPVAWKLGVRGYFCADGFHVTQCGLQGLRMISNGRWVAYRLDPGDHLKNLNGEPITGADSLRGALSRVRNPYQVPIVVADGKTRTTWVLTGTLTPVYSGNVGAEQEF